jgi:hypothetical protein
VEYVDPNDSVPDSVCPAPDVDLTCRPAYDPDYVLIEIQARGLIQIDSRTSVVIPSTANITLPALGIAANQRGLLISARAAQGNVPLIPFNSVVPVGSFARSTALAFMPPRLRIPVDLVVQFEPEMNIAPGELIIIHLPRFSGPDKAMDVALSSPPGLIDQCSWSQANRTLTFTVASLIEAGDSVTATAQSSLGVRLPDTGIVTSDGTLLISTNAAAGPVLPVSIVSYEGVGGVKQGASITFTPDVPGEDAEINVRVISVLKLYQGDTLVLTLPGFTAVRNVMDVNLVGNSTVLPRTGRWVTGISGYALEQSRDVRGSTCATCLDGDFCFASTLSVVVQKDIPAGSLMDFRILPTSKIQLPVRGFPENDPALSIGILGRDGRMLSQAFDLVQAVTGAITKPSLTLSNLLPSSVTGMTLSMTANILLEKNYIMRVYLPGFGPAETLSVTAKCVENPSRSQPACEYTLRKSISDLSVLPREYTTVGKMTTPTSPIESKPAGSITTASWDPETHVLSLTVAKEIAAKSQMTITLPEDMELRTPFLGLQQNQGDVKIAIETKRGTSDAMPFVSSPMVSALVSSSRLRVAPKTANSVVSLQIDVALTVTLSGGDLINIRLPGFTGPRADTMPLVTASNDIGIAASWTPFPGMLTIRMSEAATLPAGTVLSVSVPASYGLTLPPEGIPADSRDTGPTLSVHAPSVEILNSAHVPMADIPTVGALLKSSIKFGNRVAGGKSAVTLAFALTTPMSPGDSVTFDLPQFSAPAGSIANLALRPPVNVQRNLRPIWPTGERRCGLTGLDRATGYASCIACAKGYYGRGCSWFCDDMVTCNGNLGRGFCNNDGACTCFYPFTGPFCNTTARDPPYRPTCKPRTVCMCVMYVWIRACLLC